MDQLKEILRQAIKYRFWIAVGISALLPMIAYFIGSGPVQTLAASKETEIKNADKEVKQYSAGVPINKDYKPLVAEKTAELTTDVKNSWQKLYDRQKGLLKWPDRVHERFTKWGRAWPAAEVADSSVVHATINDYVEAYKDYVTGVYKSLHPFDPIDGTGIVAAPPEDELLRPAKFEITKLPSYGKVWASQERLWVQRALLEVVSNVNASAKDWDGAIIKQVNLLNVGSSSAQDQRSIAKGEQTEKAADIDDPAKPVADTGGGSDSSGPIGGEAMSKMMGSMMSHMGGSGGMAGAGPTEDVYYITNPSTQFKKMPVQLVVLIDQNRIQDLLVALENSPMTVEVMDFEMSKPTTKVTKPEKGNAMNFGMYGGQMGGYGMMGMMKGMGFGGDYSRQMQRMMSGQMGGYGPGMMSGQMGGYGGMVGEASKKGVDKRSENLAKKREDELKAAQKIAGNQLHDPYYNIVEVTIYGQARFFNPPPVEAPAEPSPGETAAATKDETTKDAAKEAKAKPEEEKAKAEAPKTEAPKTEAPKAEAPKAEAPKAEAPKAEAPKPEAPKAEAPKAEAPKTGAPAKL